jgi:hypothetical protein
MRPDPRSAERLRYSHPVLASICCGDASPPQRRAVHRRASRKSSRIRRSGRGGQASRRPSRSRTAPIRDGRTRTAFVAAPRPSRSSASVPTLTTRDLSPTDVEQVGCEGGWRASSRVCWLSLCPASRWGLSLREAYLRKRPSTGARSLYRREQGKKPAKEDVLSNALEHAFKGLVPKGPPAETARQALFPANSKKPTPGLEPGTPSLRVMGSCLLESPASHLRRFVTPNPLDWR